MPLKTPPAFFIPNVASDNWEAVLVELAQFSGAHLPDSGRRIYSITFRHNGETWTATVGEKLTGTKIHKSTSRGRKIEREVPLSNGSMVLVIFPGIPYRVLHDGASRYWENPFFASEHASVTYFSA